MNIQNPPQRNRKIILSLVFGLGLSVGLYTSESAFADESSSSDESSSAKDGYVGGSFGKSVFNSDGLNESLGYEIEDTSKSFSVFGGTRIVENTDGLNLYLDISYTSVPESFKLTSSTASSWIDYSIYGISIKPVFEAGDIDVFGRFGFHSYTGSVMAGAGNYSIDAGEITGFDYVFGGGVKYDLNENIGVLVTFDSYTLNEEESISIFSVGAQYNF